MMPESTPLEANPAEILHDLEYITARWHELPEPSSIEVRAFKEGSQPQIGKFSSDDLSEAVDWIESMNGTGRNVYAVRNPIRATCTGSATDADIIASFFVWADCDEGVSAENIKQWTGPKYSAAVLTGRVPSPRVHTYWELAEPCYDMAVWRETQMAIAAHFGSDRSVINPSRIMRIGGTVAYPATQKVSRGYEKEMTAIRTTYPDKRIPVTIDQMRRAFGSAPSAAGAGFQIDTGALPAPMDRDRVAIQAMSGANWNEAVLRLVGSYVRKGLSDGEIHALTDPLTMGGYTVDQTRAEVQGIIDRTRQNPKFEIATEYTPNFDHAPAPTATDPSPMAQPWKMQSAADFTRDFVAPEYIVNGVIQRGRLYTLTAPTGSGKTAVMLYAAVAIADGVEFYDREVEVGDVIFMAGENPDDVRARMIGTMEHHGINPETCRVHFIAGTFSIRNDMAQIRAAAERLPNLVLIVIDTFAAYFDGEDENSNAQALDFARVARHLTMFPSKPAVVMPAHPVKNATRGNLSPKGGSSLVNEVDGNLTLWNEGGNVTLHWQVKFRGPEFEPLSFELQRHMSDLILDSKGRQMPTILAKPMMMSRAIQIATENMSIEDKILLSIHDAPDLSLAERGVTIGVNHKMKVQRMLTKLASQKLIKKFRTNWELTKDGERAVEIITSGGKFAPDL